MELGPILRALSRNKMRSLLLVLEIAVTLAIVLNCWNIIRQQRAEILRPSGLDEENILMVGARPYGPEYQDWEFRRQLVIRDAEELRSLPGVIAATPIAPLPLQGGGSSLQAKPLGAPDSEYVRAPVYTADTHVLETLGLELVAGRGFEEADLRTDQEARIMNVLVTQDLADAMFPDGDALGQTIDTGSEEWPDVIVGIIDHMHTPYGGGPMESRILFYPGHWSSSTWMSYFVRTEPEAFDDAFASAAGVLTENEASRVTETRTLLDIKGGAQVFNEFTVRVLSVVIFLLLFVTTLGIYGMTSFSVTQRTKQIGTRRALGASRTAIVRYFLIESLLVTLIGTALGLIGAWALDSVIASHMDSTRLGSSVLVGGILLLWGLAVAATAVPALRAARLSPAIATRTA